MRFNNLFAFSLSLALLAGCSNNTTSETASESDASEQSSTDESTSDSAKEETEEKTEEKTGNDDESYTIGLAQLVDHTSLNAIRDAIISEFEELGYKDGDNLTIDYQNAAGQVSNLDTIMSDYAAEGVDAIIAIATPTAQAAQNYADEIPVIFSAVSDPVSASLVESIEEPGGNITGTSDEVQVDQVIDLMQQLTPDAKTIGCLYNSGEANSVAMIANFKEYAESKGLTVIEETGTDLTTLQQAASVLAEECDAMFSPNDNTVASGMSTLGKIAEDAGVAYYVGADSMVMDGGFATVGINYTELGKETAKMTLDILQGESPADIPVKIFKDDLNIYINEDVLKVLEENGKTKTEVPSAIAEDENLEYVTTGATPEQEEE